MSDATRHILCHHLVGFFDVLGQSSKLRQLTGLPGSDDERAGAIEILKNTAGVVLGVRRMFQDFFGAWSTPSEFVRALPPSERQLLIKATRAKVVYRGISDSFIVTTCLADTELGTAPVNGVYCAFVAGAGMWLLALSVGHPIRGGIDVGLAIDLDDDEKSTGPSWTAPVALSRVWPEAPASWSATAVSGTAQSRPSTL